MSTLGEIMDAEFGDAILGAMSDEELMGLLERAPMAAKKRLVKKAKTSASASAMSSAPLPYNSRSEFQRRIAQLPPDIQSGLRNKGLQAVDAAYYLCKDISNAKSVKMLKDDDNKVVGICNVSSAKLEKGNVFLLHGITLLSGVAAGTESISEVSYGVLPAALRNGEFELRANGTTLFYGVSNEVFDTTNSDRKKGYYQLDNPKIIRDQQAIEFNVEWAVPAAAKTFMKVILHGTSVIKN